MLPAPLWIALVRAMLVVDDGTRITPLSLYGEGSETRIPFFSTQRLPQGGRQRGGGFAAKKEANPASLRSVAPSKGRGYRGHSLLP